MLLNGFSPASTVLDDAECDGPASGCVGQMASPAVTAALGPLRAILADLPGPATAGPRQSSPGSAFQQAPAVFETISAAHGVLRAAEAAKTGIAHVGGSGGSAVGVTALALALVPASASAGALAPRRAVANCMHVA